MQVQRTEAGYKAQHWEATGLPPRASQVLVLRALGLTCAETATELGCGTETIKNRIKDLYYKLQARNNAQLINNAIVAGKLKIRRTKWVIDKT
jgi:DNA-binding NarL/FixJ family response regulator